MSYIRLVNVTKQFGDVTAVNNLNLEIGKGECFSMLGPSGCGKTTTLRMVAGFEDLSDGEVWVGDRLLSSPKKHYYTPPENRNFGMVFQAFAVWPHMSVYENVAFPLRLRKLPKSEIDQRTRDALIATNLLKSAEDSPANLSGGGKQRVALARALAINPDVMLLDEPLSSLDPHLREEMRFEIKDLQRKYGFSIIYVTHDQSEAMALSDRILVMKLGVMQQIDTPLNVYNNLIQWNTSTLGNSLDNSKVSLMWYNPLYIICCEIILLQYFQYIVTHISNGIAEYCSTLLIEVV